VQIWSATLERFCPGYIEEAQAASDGASTGLSLLASSGDGKNYIGL